MLADATYREWTEPFNPAGSSFKGDWSKGSEMLFIGVDSETGKEDGGMYSQVAENIPHKFISLEHLGELRDGVRIPWPHSGQSGFENYTFKDAGEGTTEVLIDLTNIPDEYSEWMTDLWPKSLDKLKEIAER